MHPIRRPSKSSPTRSRSVLMIREAAGIARSSAPFAAFLFAVGSALVAPSCSVEPAPEAHSAEAPASPAPATPGVVASVVPTAAALAQSTQPNPPSQPMPASNGARSEAGKAKSSWTPETLDTGVDLSSVRVGSNAPIANANGAGPDGSKTPQVQRPATTYAGGPPDSQTFALAGGPHGFLSVEEKSAIHDFGRLTQGDKVSHTFELETSGDGPLTVREIKTSCGCTVAQTEIVTAEGKIPYVLGTPLDPGTHLLVGAQLDTRTKTAAVSSVVTVVSSDPRGQLQLQLMANVSPFFAIEPKLVNFGRVEADAVVEQELVITSPIAERYMLSVMTAQMPDELTVELRPEDPDEQGRAGTWRATVVLGPNIPEGRKHYQVLFTSDQPIAHAAGPHGVSHTGEPQMHTVHVTAMAEVLGMVSATPTFFSFGLMQPGQEISRTARISNHDADVSMPAPTMTMKGVPLRVGEGSETTDEFEYADHVTFEVVPVVAGKDYDVVMTMRAPDELTGTFRGQVVLELGHPAKSTLEIPFTGVVRPGPMRPRTDGE